MKKKILYISIIVLSFIIFTAVFYYKLQTKVTIEKPISQKISDDVKINQNNEKDDLRQNNCLGLEGISKAQKHLLTSGFWASLTPSAKIAIECVEKGGQILRPVDEIIGGGKICSDESFSETWKQLPSIGEMKFHYRNVSNYSISAGTDNGDIMICDIAHYSSLGDYYLESCKEQEGDALDRILSDLCFNFRKESQEPL